MIDVDKYVDANKILVIHFIDVDMNKIGNKSLADVDKLVHGNILGIDKFVDVNKLIVIFLPCQVLFPFQQVCQK